MTPDTRAAARLPSSDRYAIGALLESWSAGKTSALDELMPLVVGELHRLAQHLFGGEAASHTLQPTALVNEVYLHLRSRRRVQWHDRAHFFGYAARTMRRILVDHARARGAEKRGGGRRPVPLDEAAPLGSPGQGIDLLALDEALHELARIDARQARVVELRYFVGFGDAEIAKILEVSERTVRRDWVTARLWLHRAMQAG